MKAWRISKAAYAEDLSGQGAARYGGRWNPVGLAAVYVGTSPSVCALEVLVHTTTGLPDPVVLSLTELELPDNPELYLRADFIGLPPGWNSLPADQASKEMGGEFLRENEKLGLIVPSVVMPMDSNIVLNPTHPAMKDVRIVKAFEYRHDDRIYELIAQKQK